MQVLVSKMIRVPDISECFRSGWRAIATRRTVIAILRHTLDRVGRILAGRNALRVFSLGAAFAVHAS
jgi:hypothetical protein